MTNKSNDWQVIDGSIFTVAEYTTKLENGTMLKQPKAIAFNVGDKIAQHVVKFHNAGNKNP